VAAEARVAARTVAVDDEANEAATAASIIVHNLSADPNADIGDDVGTYNEGDGPAHAVPVREWAQRYVTRVLPRTEGMWSVKSTIVMDECEVAPTLIRNCLQPDSTLWISDRFINAAIELVLRSTVVGERLTVGPWDGPIGVCAIGINIVIEGISQ
jgi:hypothetical protein